MHFLRIQLPFWKCKVPMEDHQGPWSTTTPTELPAVVQCDRSASGPSSYLWATVKVSWSRRTTGSTQRIMGNNSLWLFKSLNVVVVCNTSIDNKNARLWEQKQKLLPTLENQKDFPEELIIHVDSERKIRVLLQTGRAGCRVHKGLCLKQRRCLQNCNAQEGGDICILTADSCCCTRETSITL